MSNEKRPLSEGYRPSHVEKGYQPSTTPSQQGGQGPAQGGYQPATEGDNPSNNPPGRE